MPIVEQRKAGRQGGTPAPTPPLTAAELAEVIGAGDDHTRAGHLLATAWEQVRAYAPVAPEAMQREAVIRFAGYLWGSDYGGVVKEAIGPRDVEYTVNHAAMFRNSGAAALLTRWRVRRAGAIG